MLGLLTVLGSTAQAQTVNPLGVLAPETFADDKEAEKVEELSQAVESHNRRDFEQTLKALKAACEKHANLPPPRLMLARLLLASNQRQLARASLEQAVVESPDYPGTYLAFATLAVAEGRWT